jgi:hypothetical protein
MFSLTNEVVKRYGHRQHKIVVTAIVPPFSFV